MTAQLRTVNMVGQTEKKKCIDALKQLCCHPDVQKPRTANAPSPRTKT